MPSADLPKGDNWWTRPHANLIDNFQLFRECNVKPPYGSGMTYAERITQIGVGVEHDIGIIDIY